MARALTPTLLSLDRFAQIAGIHPLHFNQIYVNDLAPTIQCGTTIRQYSWQMDDGLSREEIAQGIAEAEADLEMFLGYPIAPKYYTDLIVPQRHYRADSSPWAIMLNLPKGYVQSGGFRNTSVIEEASAITYSDEDGDGYNETATVSITIPAGTTTDEVKVFYPDKSGDTSWQITPINVASDGTITFKREQCLLPELQEAYNAVAQDGSDDNNFLSTVDVYRVYTDLSVQAQLFYRSYCSTCLLAGANSSCESCTYTEQTGCISIINQRLGQVLISPSNYADGIWSSADLSIICGPIAKVRVQYLAGRGLQSNPTKIDTRFELAAARIAMTKLDRPMCACESIQHAFTYWTQDLAETVTEGQSSSTRQIAANTLECPFGTTRGGVWAWNVLKERDRLP